MICNQAASFNRCLFKVQQEMQSQLKTIRGSKKISEASDELQFLMTFNSSITQAAAKAMEHLTDFIFITMGNSTLARRDAYLSHLKNGIKPDTFAALRTAPLQLFFPILLSRGRNRKFLITIARASLLLMAGVKLVTILMKDLIERNLRVGRRANRRGRLGKT